MTQSLAMDTSRFNHALLIGGTGMLLPASAWISAHSKRVTAVARTRASLRKLEAASRTVGVVNGITADWTNGAAFEEAVIQAIQPCPPDLAVIWVHDAAIGYSIAERLPATCRVHQVFGSTIDSPLEKASCFTRLPRESLPNFHCVILGVQPEHAGLRWLTHEEISKGVVQAITTTARHLVVGIIEPWHLKP